MRGSKGSCRYNLPLRIVPDRGKRLENSIKAPIGEGSYIFADDNLRPQLVDNPEHFEEEAGPLSVEPCTLSGTGYVLAREATCEEPGALVTRAEALAIDALNASKESRFRKVSLIHPICVVVDF